MKAQPFTLLPLRQTPLETVVNLERQAFSTDVFSQAMLADFLAMPEVSGFAATLEGELAGYVMARGVLEEAEILSIAVAPAWRRRGVGRQLLTAAFAELAQNGARRVFLDVRPSNRAACSLYEALGGTLVSRRLKYYTAADGGPVEDALVYKVTLPVDFPGNE